MFLFRFKILYGPELIIYLSLYLYLKIQFCQYLGWIYFYSKWIFQDYLYFIVVYKINYIYILLVKDRLDKSRN